MSARLARGGLDWWDLGSWHPLDQGKRGLMIRCRPSPPRLPPIRLANWVMPRTTAERAHAAARERKDWFTLAATMTVRTSNTTTRSLAPPPTTAEQRHPRRSTMGPHCVDVWPHSSLVPATPISRLYDNSGERRSVWSSRTRGLLASVTDVSSPTPRPGASTYRSRRTSITWTTSGWRLA